MQAKRGLPLELWQGVTLEPIDGIFALKARCDSDTFPQKIDLSVGAYRAEDAKPWTLPVVRKVCFVDVGMHSPFLMHARRCGSPGCHSISE